MRVGLLFLVLLAACTRASEPETLRVFAAASLRDLLEARVPAFVAATGVTPRISTGGSNLVAAQLLAGAEADVFVSAGELEMLRLVEAGLVDAEAVRALFSNRLVVIAPAGHTGPFALEQLGRAKRVALAHPEAVPAGRYAKAWLDSRGLWETVEPHVVRGLDVRAALAAVASGGAEYGIVYASDAGRSTAVEVVYEVPAGEGPKILYPGAPLRASNQPALAAVFLELLGDSSAASTAAWRARVHDLGFTFAESAP